METMEIIDQLEDTIERGFNIPFTGKCLADKDELMEIIQELRIKLPDDLKQAKWIKEERQSILLEAQKEANSIIKTAEDKIISMINESEITRLATQKSEEIITNANKRSKDIKMGTRQYVDDVLSDVEQIMEKTLNALRENRIAMKEKESKRQMKIEEVNE